MSEKLFNDMERDARLAALYRAAAQNEPPAALDDAIRAAARRAVSSKPRLTGWPFSHSWGVPVSIAAVIVLSVSMVAVMREEAPEILEPPRAEAPTMGADRKREPAASDRASAVPNTIPAPKTAQSNDIGLNPPHPAVPPATGIRGNTAAPPLVAKSEKDGLANEQAPSAPPLLTKRAPAEAFPAQSDIRDKASASDEQPRQSAKEEVRRDDGTMSAPQARSATPSRQADAQPSFSADAKTPRRPEAEGEGANTASRESERPRVQAAPESKPASAASAAPPQVPKTIAKPASPVAGAIQGYIELPPEKWLERIADLRKQGRLEEAKASFTAFRKRYPDYPLPELLKDWTNP
ncbi:MAG TPA: hypothetical protein VGQ88_03115 [Burkholderiales bacterium]|nr:hypothetical protein [Burkholderiales bacterium]